MGLPYFEQGAVGQPAGVGTDRPAAAPPLTLTRIVCISIRPFSETGFDVGLCKILYYFQSFGHELIVLSFFRPAYIAHAIAIRLHDCCAIYNPPSTCLLYARYARHYTILVITISCKGQGPSILKRRIEDVISASWCRHCPSQKTRA